MFVTLSLIFVIDTLSKDLAKTIYKPYIVVLTSFDYTVSVGGNIVSFSFHLQSSDVEDFN